ncbi:MAG: LamG domain-containing protein [Phycisphaerae bacterium]|jgi:hypothetical protein|nr:LamG domain-containing protein [Phycisphaerae bacterium]
MLKMRNGAICGCLTVVVLLAVSACAAGDEVDDLINEVIKGASTNAARASALLEATRLIESGTAEVKIRFLSRAIEFGLKGGAKGYEAADKAIDAILAAAPDQAAAWEGKRLALYRRWLGGKAGLRQPARAEKFVEILLRTARRHEQANEWVQALALYREATVVAARFRMGLGDTIKTRVRLATHRNRVWTKIKSLTRTVAADPSNASARQGLLLVMVAEADAPAQAAAHLNADVAEAWRKYVPLAAGDVGEVRVDDCLGLVHWYSRGLGPMRDPHAKYVTLRRVKVYAERFLSLHEEKDIQGVKVRLLLAQAQRDIPKLARQLGLSTDGIVPRKGLVLHYSFDTDGRGKVIDRSGKGHHGKVSGAKWVRNVRGAGNGGILLDGKDNVIYMPPATVGNLSSLTYSVWVKMPRYAGKSWPVFIGGHTTGAPVNISIGLFQNTGHLRLEVDTDAGNYAAEGTLAVPWQKWFHAAMVYDGATMTEYVNGVRGRSAKASGKLKSLRMFTIGRDHAKYDALRGVVDDVMVFNRALTEKEIKQIYKAQGAPTK